ncbi:MAG: hypothetical protein KBA46_07750 [Candidatus Omnitrophica bacterium]|nr:hypothetical protein [Candidatus Omnitrophota bacterium]
MKQKMRVVFLFVAISFLCLMGCQTTKGVAQGVGTGVVGVATGVPKDAMTFWQGLMAADAWLREHLW